MSRSSKLTRDSVSKRIDFSMPASSKSNNLNRNKQLTKKGSSPLKNHRRNSAFNAMFTSPSKMKSPAKLRSPHKRQCRTKDKERFDVTKMNTAEYDDLLAGVDIDSKAENFQKKQDNIQKKNSENALCDEISNINNIYSSIQETAGNSEETQAQNSSVGPDGPNPTSGGTEEHQKTINEEPSNGDDLESNGKDHLPADKPTNDGKANNSSMPLNSMPTDSSLLDTTISIFENQTTQTDAILIAPCSCEKCLGVTKDIFKLLVHHNMMCKTNVHLPASPFRSTPSTPNPSAQTLTSSKGAANDDEEKLVLLVQHCPQVKISLSKKAAITVEVPDGDPQKMVHYLLDCLFTTEQLAGMTSDGKTEGCTALDKDIARILEIYVNSKYDSKLFNFNNKLFKQFVNKCHKALRHIWKHNPELVGKTVRGKLQKNVRKEGNDKPVKKGKPSSMNRYKTSPKRRSFSKEQLDERQHSPRHRHKKRGQSNINDIEFESRKRSASKKGRDNDDEAEPKLKMRKNDKSGSDSVDRKNKRNNVQVRGNYRYESDNDGAVEERVKADSIDSLEISPKKSRYVDKSKGRAAGMSHKRNEEPRRGRDDDKDRGRIFYKKNDEPQRSRDDDSGKGRGGMLYKRKDGTGGNQGDLVFDSERHLLARKKFVAEQDYDGYQNVDRRFQWDNEERPGNVKFDLLPQKDHSRKEPFNYHPLTGQKQPKASILKSYELQTSTPIPGQKSLSAEEEFSSSYEEESGSDS